jgi:hypothetical protein
LFIRAQTANPGVFFFTYNTPVKRGQIFMREGLLGELDAAKAALDRILTRISKARPEEKLELMRTAESLQSRVQGIIQAIQRLSN